MGQPAFLGPYAPGSMPSGSGYALPTQPKSRAGLFIGLGVGAVILISVAVGLGYLAMSSSNGSGPSANQNSSNPARLNNSSGQDNSIRGGTFPRPTPQISRPQQLPGPGPALDGAANAEITGALNGWTQAIGKRDINAIAGHYTNEIQPYFLAPRAPIEAVKGDMFRAFAQYSTLDVHVSNVNVQADPDGIHATATFDKTYKFSGTSSSLNGTVQEQIQFVKQGGQWLISGIHDLKSN
jgi:ketosteroid isomerase-like protein